MLGRDGDARELLLTVPPPLHTPLLLTASYLTSAIFPFLRHSAASAYWLAFGRRAAANLLLAAACLLRPSYLVSEGLLRFHKNMRNDENKSEIEK